MAQTVAVVRNTLTATGAGTTDFTKTGFGTPTAAIIIACTANSTANPAVNGRMSIGFWDGTNQRSVGIYCEDGAATSVTARASDDSYGMILSADGLASAAFTVSSITDGIRLTMSVDNTSLQFFCTVLLLAGVSANVATFTPNATQNATQASASLGFAPKLIFFTTIGAAAADQAIATAIISFGFAAIDGTHRMLAFSATDAAADEAASLQYSETRCVGQIVAGAVTWTGEVTTFGADTYTMTTRDGASGSDVCFALALGGADLSYDTGTLTTPTSTGNQANATDIAADALLLALSTSQGTTMETDADANGYMIGLADDNGQFAHNMSVEDAAATMNCNSAAQATAVLDLDSSSGGTRTDMCDATVTLNSADFTLNFSATDATARKGFWVAFGTAAAGGLVVNPFSGRGGGAAQPVYMARA